jgi:GNAT superfamily N-acetyltransferase
LRWARASSHYEATVAFYRDLVGLPIVGDFAGSFGDDGTIFGLPDTRTQLEIVRAHNADEPTGSVDQLVLYLSDPAAVARATKTLRQQGFTPDSSPPAYWAANGAVIFDDPDGRGVVFAPWVYGRDPEPADVEANGPSAADFHVEVHEYLDDRAALRALFEEAEDSAAQLDDYLHLGQVLVAQRGPDVIGHLQLVEATSYGEVELKNMAVQADQRGTGIGRRLVETALRISADAGLTRMTVATAAADIGNLRFYQRCGFRFSAIERDAFTPQTGYPDPIDIEGIPLRDRVWLAHDM